MQPTTNPKIASGIPQHSQEFATNNSPPSTNGPPRDSRISIKNGLLKKVPSIKGIPVHPNNTRSLDLWRVEPFSSLELNFILCFFSLRLILSATEIFPSYTLFLKPLRHIFTPHASQRVANLAEGDVILHALNEERHQVIAPARGRFQLAE